MNLSIENLIIIIVITAVFLLITALMEFRKKSHKPEYITKELLECIKCRYTVVRDFEPGDFIPMYKGKCPKCGSPMKIKAIYNIEKKF